MADTLIKLELETRQKRGDADEREEVLWMTKMPKLKQTVFYLNDKSEEGYFKASWYASTFDIKEFNLKNVFDSEAKIRKHLGLD